MYKDLKDKTINERLRYFRKIKELSQSDIAELLGMKSSTYSQKERVGSLDAEFLKDICRVLDVDVRLILYGELPEGETPHEPSLILKPKEEHVIKMMRSVKKEEFTRLYGIICESFKNR